MLCGNLFGQNPNPADSSSVTESKETKNRQLIVWSSGDREVALKMVFMYANNCKKRGWMDTVRLLVWGPSGKLLLEDEELRKNLNILKETGVELYACKGCADLYGISDQLSALGINVMYTGTMLADLQKEGWHVLTF
ncbi:MAG: DsrE family protein [Calditrichaeota bacterium]|nr:MAG: DsrE family protein [Calditrichota bacterium]